MLIACPPKRIGGGVNRLICQFSGTPKQNGGVVI